MKEKIYQELCTAAGKENVLLKEPMSRHTTFRIGGPADYFVVPDTVEQLSQLVKICIKEEIPYFILGNGSNLLVSDEGYRGVVLQLYRNMCDICVKGSQVHAQAGALLSQIAKKAQEHNLTGFEFAGGIPGTLGGAAVMNAGAYGGEMKEILAQVTVLDQQGNVLTLPSDSLQMGYRTSIIKEKQYIVLEAVIQLAKGDPDVIAERMEELKELRVSKQPLDYPSAGSTFKRPAGYFAGKLIMDAGLAGYSVGDAQVSEKHCGFVINQRNATAEEVKTLMLHVRDQVKEKFGVELEPEVKFLGFQWDK
ncbi:MAG: UDP-N-acetylmuramate dehydrogenase [Lachnospiraceae bacterium]